MSGGLSLQLLWHSSPRLELGESLPLKPQQKLSPQKPRQSASGSTDVELDFAPTIISEKMMVWDVPSRMSVKVVLLLTYIAGLRFGFETL